MPTSLNARFTADFSQLEQAVAAADVNIQVFEKAISTTARELGKLGGSFSGANIQRDALLASRAIDSIGGVTKLTAAEQKKWVATFDEAIAKAKAMGTSVPADVQKVATELQNATKGAGVFETALTGVAGKLTNLGGSSAGLSSVTGYFRDFGPTALLAGAAIGTAAAAVDVWAGVIKQSVSAAADFQTSLTRIANLSSEDSSHINQMGDALLAMAPKVGKGPQELANALYFATSAGLKGAEALDVVEKAAEASAVGLGQTDVIIRAVTAAMTTYRDQGLTAAQATNVLTATVKEAHIPADSLASSLGRVISIAHEAGVTFDQVGAYLATFTRTGVSAEEAVTALRGLMKLIIDPARQSRDALAQVGLSVAELRAEIKEKGLTATMVDLYQHLELNQEGMQAMAEATGINLDALGKIIPNVRALAGYLSNAGSQGKEFVKVQEEITAAMHDADYTHRRFLETEKTLTQQLDELKAGIQAASVQIGNDFLPALTELTKDAKPAVESLFDLAHVLTQLVAKHFTVTVAIATTWAGILKPPTGGIAGGIAGAVGSANEFLNMGDDWMREQIQGSQAQANVERNLTTAFTNAPNIATIFGQDTNQSAVIVRQATASMSDYAKKLQDVRAQVAALSETQRTQLNAALALGGEDAKKAAKELGLNAEQLRIFQSETKETAKDVKDAASEAQKAAEQVQQQIDKLSGKEAIADAKRLVDALDAIGGVKLIDPEQAQSMLNDINAGIDASTRMGAAGAAAFGQERLAAMQYAAELGKIVTQYKEQQDFPKLVAQAVKTDVKAISTEIGKWSDEEAKLTVALQKSGEALAEAQLAGYSKGLQDLFKTVAKGTDEIDKLTEESHGTTGSLKDLYDQIIALKEADLAAVFQRALVTVPELATALRAMAAVFPQLAGAFPGVFAGIATHAQTAKKEIDPVIASFRNLAQAFTNLSQVSGNTGFAQSIAQIFSTVDIAVQSVGKVEEAIKALGEEVKPSLAKTFADIATGLVTGFAGLVSSTDASKSTMTRAISGAISGAGLGASIGASIGAIVASSATTGAEVGGAWGAAAGAIVGVFIAVFSGRATRAEMEKVGQEWGISISQGLAQTLTGAGKALPGGTDTAAILHMADILKEGGGVTVANVDQLLPKLHDVFSFLERKQITTAQAQQVLNDNFAQFAAIIQQTGHLAPQVFQDVVRLNAAMGVNAKAIADFVAQQASTLGTVVSQLAGPLTDQYGGLADQIKAAQKALDDFNTANAGKKPDDLGVADKKQQADLTKTLNDLLDKQAKGAATAGDELNRLGLIALGSFNAAIGAGQDYLSAVNAIGPGLDKLIGLQKDLGLPVDNPAVAELEHFRDLVNANQSLVASAGALGQGLQALTSIGGLTTDTLKAMEDQGLETFHRLQEAGFSDNEALQQMAGFLSNVIQAHQQLGTPIDENTQALIDQANKAGLLQGKTKSATDVMETGFAGVIQAIERLTGALTHDVPDAANAAAQAIGKIPKDFTITPHIDLPTDDGSPANTRTPPTTEAPAPPTATGGIVTKAQTRLVGEAGPEAIVPLDRLPSLLPHPIGATGFQNGFFDKLTDAGQQAGSTLTSSFSTVSAAAASLQGHIEAIGAALTTALPTAAKQAATITSGAANQIRQSFTKIATGSDDVQGVFLGMADPAQLITDKVDELTKSLGLTQDQADDLRRAFEEGSRQVDRGFMSNTDGVNHVTRGLSEAIDATKTYARILSALPKDVDTTVHVAYDDSRVVPAALPEPPPTATGGIVTRPQIRLVGEQGPEAIIPLDRLRPAPASSEDTPTVEVTVTIENLVVHGDADKQVAQQIGESLAKEIMRGGRLKSLWREAVA